MNTYEMFGNCTHKVSQSGLAGGSDLLKKFQGIIRPSVNHVHANSIVHVMLKEHM